MARDITVHFVGNARDLAVSAALAGESVERFGHKVVTAGAEAATASAGFNLANVQLFDMGRKGVTPTNALIALGAAATTAASPAIVALTGFLADLTLGLTLFTGLAGLGGGIVALAAWSAGWLDAGSNLEKAEKKLDAAKEAIERHGRVTQEDLARLKQAQNEYNAALVAADNPLTRFNNHIQEMGKRLGQQALPMATRILEWADSMLSKVEELGKRLISWFGPRLEPTLKLASQLFEDVMTAIEELGRSLAPVFDKLLKNPEEFRQAFVKAAGMVIGAVVGLVQNFQRAADWWTGPEGQHFQSQAEAVLDFIGHLVQGLIITFYTIARAMSYVGDRFDELGRNVGKFTGPLRTAINLWDALMRRVGGGLPPPPIGWGVEPMIGEYQYGGVVPGPIGMPQLAVVHGGETITPPGRAPAGATYNVNVYPSPLANPAEVGSAVVAAIQEYERRAGTAWRT